MDMPLDDNLMRKLEDLKPAAPAVIASDLFKPASSCHCTGNCGDVCAHKCNATCSNHRK